MIEANHEASQLSSQKASSSEEIDGIRDRTSSVTSSAQSEIWRCAISLHFCQLRAVRNQKMPEIVPGKHRPTLQGFSHNMYSRGSIDLRLTIRTIGVNFDVVAREIRCKWSVDNDKASLVALQATLEKHIDALKVSYSFVCYIRVCQQQQRQNNLHIFFT